jgi:hypothetical protein
MPTQLRPPDPLRWLDVEAVPPCEVSWVLSTWYVIEPVAWLVLAETLKLPVNRLSEG